MRVLFRSCQPRRHLFRPRLAPVLHRRQRRAGGGRRARADDSVPAAGLRRFDRFRSRRGDRRLGPRVLAQVTSAPLPPAGEGGAKRRVRVRLLMLPAKSRALTPTPLPKAGEGLPIARSVRRVTLPSPQSPVPAPPPIRIHTHTPFPHFVP